MKMATEEQQDACDNGESSVEIIEEVKDPNVKGKSNISLVLKYSLICWKIIQKKNM